MYFIEVTPYEGGAIYEPKIKVKCPACDGYGIFREKECSACNGSGMQEIKYEEKETLWTNMAYTRVINYQNKYL